MTSPDGHDSFDGLLAEAMNARPAPRSIPQLAAHARARALEQPPLRAHVRSPRRHLIINALAAVVVVGVLLAILRLDLSGSQSATDQSSPSALTGDDSSIPSGDEMVVIIVAAAASVGLLLTIEICLRDDRSALPHLKLAN